MSERSIPVGGDSTSQCLRRLAPTEDDGGRSPISEGQRPIFGMTESQNEEVLPITHCFAVYFRRDTTHTTPRPKAGPGRAPLPLPSVIGVPASPRMDTHRHPVPRSSIAPCDGEIT